MDTQNTIHIKSLTSDRSPRNPSGAITACFAVISNNGETTLEQDLVLTNSGNGWVAEMTMNDFPRQKTVTATAWQLANWPTGWNAWRRRLSRIVTLGLLA